MESDDDHGECKEEKTDEGIFEESNDGVNVEAGNGEFSIKWQRNFGELENVRTHE